MAKTIKIDITCPFCGKEYQVEVPEDGYNRWLDGELIQRAMPTVVPEDREALISGICTECWDKTFGGEDNAY
jgi:hypothetical protein